MVSTAWDRPIHRRPVPEPPALRGLRVLEPGEHPRFEDAVEAMIALSHWKRATKAAARFNLLSGRMKAFREERGIDTIADFSHVHALEFLAGYRAAGAAPSSLHKLRAHLVSLDKFCKTVAGYECNLNAEAIPRPKLPRRLDRPIITPEEELTLASACRVERDRLILGILVATGMRAGELVALQVGDCYLDAGLPYLHVRRSAGSTTTKGGYDRKVPVTMAMAKRLRMWLQKGRKETWRTEVFLSTRGTPLAVDSLEAVFERLSNTTGIYVRPHMLRHTWATRAANAGVPLFQLQQAGGWRSVEMVRVYFTADPTAMLEAFRRAEG